MTMVVKAKRGNSEFHVGTSTWCALADICLLVAPGLCASCRHWYTNDGDGLDAESSGKLADALQARLSDGTVDRLIAERLAHANAIPNETCSQCGGTGIRADAIGIKNGYDKCQITEPGHPRFGQQGWCNGCSGHGSRRPFSAYYPLEDGTTVAELISFLRGSGGFRIW